MLCKLGTTRDRVAFARGGLDADVLVLGEAPGADEDLLGMPMVGRAGQRLDEMVAALGIAPDDIYFANVLKCRPPQNRSPEGDELDACRPHWMRQIELVAPRVIITLGRVASQAVLKTTDPMSMLRGEWRSYGPIRVMPTFHPAYVLRRPEVKRDVWNDLTNVQHWLREQAG